MIVKSILLAFLLFPGALVNADETPLTREQLADYKEAVLLAYKADYGALRCEQIGEGLSPNIQSLINSATSGAINLVGNQPLLTFSEIKVDTKSAVTVNSTSDFKKIELLKAEEFSKKEVNDGDLRKPIITQGFRSIGLVKCIHEGK